MLNKKFKTYILLIVVIAIWGTVAFQIFNGINGFEEIVVADHPQNSGTNMPDQTKDTFSLKPIERDPFLDQPIRTSVLQKTASKKRNIKKEPFPNVVYHGSISQNRATVYIIGMNGSQLMLKRGQKQNELKVIKGNSGSITLKYKNQVKTFKKL